MKKSNTLFLSTTTKRIIPMVFFVFLLLSSSFVLGAARTASVSGLWSSTATWGGAAIPTSADAVTINSGITVTVDMAAQCASLTFAAVAASSTVTISGTNSLAIIGLLSMPRPSSGFLCTVNVNAGTLTCGTLTMSATTSGRNDVFNITSGSATISGNATTGTTGCIFNFTGAGSLFFGGTISSTPTLTTFSGSTVSYTSASSQTVLAGSYSNLTLSGAGAKTLNGASSVSGNLTLTSGILTTTTTNLLSITNTTSTAIFGGSTTSYISGPLKWTLPASLASGSNYNFPVGKGGVYLPFSLNSPTTGTGTVTAQVEAFNVSAAGTYDASLTSTSTTE